MSNESSLQQLAEIRSMMERSSRFISLSGLSGVLAGTYALIGAALVKYFPYSKADYYRDATLQLDWSALLYYMTIAFSVMAVSLLTGFILTRNRAKTQNRKLIDKTALRMLINLIIPISAGGAFALILLFRGYYDLLAPTMLMFYGLGLINGGKYTLDDIRYLGLSELILGLICALDPGNGLLYWSIGFGALHIFYGSRMWWKYERKSA